MQISLACLINGEPADCCNKTDVILEEKQEWLLDQEILQLKKVSKSKIFFHQK